MSLSRGRRDRKHGRLHMSVPSSYKRLGIQSSDTWTSTSAHSAISLAVDGSTEGRTTSSVTSRPNPPPSRVAKWTLAPTLEPSIRPSAHGPPSGARYGSRLRIQPRIAARVGPVARSTHGPGDSKRQVHMAVRGHNMALPASSCGEGFCRVERVHGLLGYGSLMRSGAG